MLSILGCKPYRGRGNNAEPEGQFMYWRYWLTNGRMMYPLKYLKLDRDEEGLARLAFSDEKGPDVTVIRVSEDVMKQVSDMVTEYSLKKLKNTYVPLGDVRDGVMWGLHIGYEKNPIGSGGSNAWPPEKLWSGVKAVNEYLDSLAKAAGESDVIEHWSHLERDLF